MCLNHPVDHIGARNDGPADTAFASTQWIGFGNLRAALAGKPPRKGVAEKRVGPLGFDSAVNGHQTRGVRYVANERLVSCRRGGFRRSAVAIGELHACSFMRA